MKVGVEQRGRGVIASATSCLQGGESVHIVGESTWWKIYSRFFLFPRDKVPEANRVGRRLHNLMKSNFFNKLVCRAELCLKLNTNSFYCVKHVLFELKSNCVLFKLV